MTSGQAFPDISRSETRSEFICSNCRDVDLAAALIGHICKESYDPYEYVRRKSDHNAKWECELTELCQLCEFLKSAGVQQTDSKHPIVVHHGYPAPTTFSLAGSKSFGVVDCATALHQDDEHSISPRLAAFIDDYDHIYSEVSDCPPATRYISGKRCVDDDELTLLHPIKVIDCQTRQIHVAPDECVYMTLSYVWGAPDTSYSTSVWPQTIEDAITVTLRLGYRYLWVDKYCINQNDAEDKETQIQQMDRIYRNAKACIVAAMGDNSDAGLSGISVARPTLGVQVDGLTFAIYNDNPVGSFIVPSKWWSRGWTFQEMLFSRKRIFFTEQEVLVHCNCGIARETPSRVFPSALLDRFRWPVDDLNSEIWELISDYSSRSLTYPTDILKAFQGVSNATEGDNSRGTQLRLIWGLPVCDPPTPDYTPTSYFLKGLMWKPASAVSGHWRRRPGFPSFSWVGWIEPVLFTGARMDLSCRVWVEQEAEEETDLDQYYLSLLEQPTKSHLLPFLQIECPCIQVEVRWLPQTKQRPIRFFVGADRSHWIAPIVPEMYDLRSELDSKYGQGGQRSVSLCGLVLQALEFMTGHLILFYDMGNHWERVGDLPLIHVSETIRRCQVSKLHSGSEVIYEDESPPDMLSDWYFPKEELDEWMSMLSIERKKFRLG